MDTAFTIYTGVFIAYWLGTVLMLSSAALTGAGLGFLEFMRLWIKPLFWMNFSYFAVAEVIFSAIYWFGFAFMSLTGFMRPMAWLVGIVEPPSDSDDPVFVWAVLSILLFMLIMAPYTYVHARVTKFFKRLMLKTLSPEFGATQASLIKQAPNKLLPTEFVRAIIGQIPEQRKWIEQCFSPGSENKFRLQTANADHMTWSIDGSHVDFWESRIIFCKRTPTIDSNGDRTYNSDYSTHFDGLVMRLEAMMPSAWDRTVVEVPFSSAETMPVRDEHKQGFFITLIEKLLKKHGKHGSERTSTLQDYPESLPRVEVAADHRICYVGVEGKDLYLFVSTDLGGTMFDFNMNIGAAASLELFRQDLQLVKTYLDIAPSVVDAMEQFRAASFREAA